MSNNPRKCYVISIIGEPNAGKSTLLNAILDEKIAPVTHKAQTTRKNLRGIYIKDETQIIFVDTPGIFKPSGDLERKIVKEAWFGLENADAACLIIDCIRGLNENLELIINHLQRKNKPTYMVLNKVDLIEKPKLVALAILLEKYNLFRSIFMVSALKQKGLEQMLSKLVADSPYSEWLFSEDNITDIAVRDLAAEITREQIFIRVHDELPYSVKVEPEAWLETDDEIRIYQNIYVLKESQKKILIGNNASMIKVISRNARHQIIHRINLQDKKVHLYLYVKVKSEWINEEVM